MKGKNEASAYCICGGAMRVSSPSQDAVRAAIKAFWSVHQGEGHAACDSATAAGARRRAEKRRET